MGLAARSYAEARLGRERSMAALDQTLAELLDDGRSARLPHPLRRTPARRRRPRPATGRFVKRALITGITGQDGSYLAELLLEKGYEVHGLIRRASTFNTARIDHLYRDPHDPTTRLFLHYGDLTDGCRLVTLLEKIQPDEVYNLAAQSHVRVSFDEPEYTGHDDRPRDDAAARGDPDDRARLPVLPGSSSSEMFGATPPPQNEETPFYPRSPVRRGEGLRRTG